jgi:hypothetical protein
MLPNQEYEAAMTTVDFLTPQNASSLRERSADRSTRGYARFKKLVMLKTTYVDLYESFSTTWNVICFCWVRRAILCLIRPFQALLNKYFVDLHLMLSPSKGQFFKKDSMGSPELVEGGESMCARTTDGHGAVFIHERRFLNQRAKK